MRLLTERAEQTEWLHGETPSSEVGETELVERARAGDREAFGELVRLHRAKALGLAYNLTQDFCTAEDVVQEALIRAFMHLGSLVDTTRFTPWLTRIIRNQAYMKLQRGGPYAKEQPFSSMSKQTSGDGAANDVARIEKTDWGSIDNILFQMAKRASVDINQQNEPVERILRRETLQGLNDLLRCLTRRERSIFEAFFFSQIPPSEIAAMFGKTTAYVYNSLSRSKAVPPEKVEQVITLIQRSIDRGIPAISADLFNPEFGLIYGYDDEKQLFHAKDGSKAGTLTYAEFAAAKFVLFAVTIGESMPQTKTESLRLALEIIIDHARGRERQYIFEGKYVIGLAGYEAWIKAFDEQRIHVVGNAYNTAVVADARRFAALFLRELAAKWDRDTGLERLVRRLAMEASAVYEKAAAALWEMHEMFPFPRGGEPGDLEEAQRAIVLLEIALDAETNGAFTYVELFNSTKRSDSSCRHEVLPVRC